VLQVSWVATAGTLVAVGTCLLAVLLLYRRITAIGRLSTLLWVVVHGHDWVDYLHGFDTLQQPLRV